MSQPSIPNITPLITVTKKETISLLLGSIAMNELSMSHIINAEAEKMQAFVQHAERSMSIKTKDYIQFNNTVSKFMEEIIMEHWLSLNKLDRVIQLVDEHFHEGAFDNCTEEGKEINVEYYDE
ncbi:hypothetical protein [Paenibacillus medicaginis]|uniref:Uncharacterized protein n=1 Tax=Paenibacillus medicaginis TaxID=1470560 RepID=A0ABV5C616_9BACL